MINSINKTELDKLNIQFLFITAASPEEESFLSNLKPLDSSDGTQFIGNNQKYRIGFLGNYLVAHVHCKQQGSTKPDASMLTIKEAYDDIKPSCVIMVGIAYGACASKQNIGDILVSRNIQPYHAIRVSTDSDGKIHKQDRNTPMKPGSSILNQFENFQFPRSDVNVYCGTLLSGEELVDNSEYKEYLIKTFSENGSIDWNDENKIVGGEMEGVGLSSVLGRAENSNWIIVKSICDWADGQKKLNKKERQAIASRNAVDYCVQFFKTDLPKNIRGVRITRKNHKVHKDDVIINGYVLFALRNDKCIAHSKLHKQTKIYEKTLKEFEEFSIVQGKPNFKKTSLQNLKKIKKALDCGDEITQEITDDKYIKFFINKNRKGFCPISDAKIVVFDFDGTLTINDKFKTSWQMVWDYLGYSLAICNSLHRKFSNEELSHADWCLETAEYFKKKKLSRSMMQEISSQIQIIDGLSETLNVLKQNNVELYICSGSIDVIISNVLGENIAFFKEIKSNEFAYDENAELLKAIIGTKYDFEGKADFIKELAKKRNIKTSDIIFVGNSNNDEFAINSGAKTLVVNPHLTDGFNRCHWKYHAGNITNLSEILPYILPSKYHLPDIME